jgi:CheY-like chemotaxis protein/anti-sigma regulatory factor (Ser/Thr protein kinase)
VALSGVVEAAVELLVYSLQQDRVETRLELGEVPSIHADTHQLQQVLINLITNAHHAVREMNGPRRVTVRTRFDAERSRVILEVADTGPGVPLELRQRVFEPFFTTKPADRGTGLGLPLCQEIVQAHGGTLAVEDAEGGGALFRIELPVGEAVPVAAELVPEAVPDGVARSILVVDDEPDVAEVLAESLRTWGHRVDVALGGVAGLARLAKGRYDLVFTDMKMPDLDGRTLFREAASLDPALPRRFVFTTGDGLSKDTQGFFDGTGQPCLRKPYDFSEVHRVVNRVLAKAR